MTTISPSVSSGEHAARSFAARRHGAFIDGRFEVLDGAEPLVVENPATEEQLAVVPASSAASSTGRSRARRARSPTAAGRG